jgi:hypothetical protein
MMKKINEYNSVGRSLKNNDESHLSEKAGSAVVISFGRLNPPTSGHEKLVNKVKSVAKKQGADAQIYLSHSADKKKNPLPYKDKLKFAKKAFGSVIKKSNARTIMQVLSELDSSYDEVYIVVGSDRISEFSKLVNKYNGKDYNYSKIELVSAGERDPDADDVSGMSASKLRSLAANGEYDEFLTGLPSKLNDRDSKSMYDIIRKNMGISEDISEEKDYFIKGLDLGDVKAKFVRRGKSMSSPIFIKVTDSDTGKSHEMGPYRKMDIARKELSKMHESEIVEVLDQRQRMKRKQVMRRLKSKIQRGKKIALKKRATPEKLKTRAQRQAKEIIRKKVAGKGGVNYKDLPVSGRMAIDKKVEKKKSAIARIAKKLKGKVKRDETERFAKMQSKKNEELITLLMPIIEQVEYETISESITKNLLKKSERYGISSEEIKRMYVDCRGAYYTQESNLSEEQWTFNRLNVIIANKQKMKINEAINYHLVEDIPFSENIFRMHSANYYKLYTEAKKQYATGTLSVGDSFDHELLTSDIGEFDLYEGFEVPLDLPMLDEDEDVELNKPMRGGPKKFYVYVKDPATDNVKKVSFGDTSGLKVKLNDPAARKSFVARHQCDLKKDKTKPGYWSCRLPYYAKQLGLSGGGNFFW